MKHVIPISKTKSWMLFSGSLAFVFGGLTLPLINLKVNEAPFSSAAVNTVATITVLFFGLCAWMWWKKIMQQNVGLQVDEQGVIDQSSGVSLGRIHWHDIKAVEEFSMVGQPFVVLKLSNPDAYIAKSNSFVRKIHQANIKLCGSPAAISANALQIDHLGLLNLLQKAFQDYREAAAQT